MIRTVAIIVGVLICMSAYAGTWKDDFAGGDLNRWLKFDYGEIPIAGVNWDEINGKLVATVEGGRNADNVVVVPAGGWVLPAQALFELSEQDDLIVEVNLEVEPIPNLKAEPFAGFGEVYRLIGMSIAQKDDVFLYRISWYPDFGEIEVSFLGPRVRLMNSRIPVKGTNPVPVQGEIEKWHKMRLIMRQRPFQVKVYWDGVLITEFGAPFIPRAKDDDFPLPIGLRAEDDIFPIGAVGLWAEGYAFRAYFDDFVMAWGDTAKVSAVHPRSKLTTTWGEMKASREENITTATSKGVRLSAGVPTKKSVKRYKSTVNYLLESIDPV